MQKHRTVDGVEKGFVIFGEQWFRLPRGFGSGGLP